jgi:hypothetical protein
VVKSRIEYGLGHNLSEDFVLKLYQLINEEAIQLQEKVISD